MPELTETVDAYLDAWNETDPARRRALVDAVWAEDGSYLDPLMAADGHAGLDAMIAGAQQQFPGHVFALVTGPDAHHDRVRFTWELRAPEGGAVVATGYDFATVADDARLRAVTGFLELAAA
jgi:hypothetical protein